MSGQGGHTEKEPSYLSGVWESQPRKHKFVEQSNREERSQGRGREARKEGGSSSNLLRGSP